MLNWLAKLVGYQVTAVSTDGWRYRAWHPTRNKAIADWDALCKRAVENRWHEIEARHRGSLIAICTTTFDA
jgi:hypothetical protein